LTIPQHLGWKRHEYPDDPTDLSEIVKSPEFEFDSKGNISMQQKFDASGNLIEKLILKYDNFKNPFHGLHTNYDCTFELITSPNNIIKEIHQYGDEVIGTVFIFDYDSNGFPVKYEIRDIRDVDIPYNYPFYKINYRK